MSYNGRPQRRRSSGGALLAAAAIVACLLVVAGGLAGWWLRGQSAVASATPVVTGALAATSTPVAAQASETAPQAVEVAPLATPTVALVVAASATSAADVSVASSATPASGRIVAPPDLAGLQAYALELINQDRQAAGLSAVAWDSTAATLAQRHAEDMLDGQFFSHWNREGYGPDHRAAMDEGMTDAVFENIHTYSLRFDDGQPAPIQDWRQRILDAHRGLMASPGHRRNIMDPAHTHVGIGIAYAPDMGEMRLVQEFVNRYVELDPMPARLPVGSELRISGHLLNGASNPLVNVAYETFPKPMTVEQLAETNTYAPAAHFFSAPRTTEDEDRFSTRAILDFDGQTGLYHVWVFVTVDGQETLAAAPIVVVE